MAFWVGKYGVCVCWEAPVFIRVSPCVFQQVIKTLDPKQQSPSLSPELLTLKNQLSEKERKIQHLEVGTSSLQSQTQTVL